MLGIVWGRVFPPHPRAAGQLAVWRSMAFPVRRMMARLLAGVAAALLAGALLAPAPARAGCGDHLRPLQTDATPTSFRGVAVPAAPAQPAPAPCHGPGCSRAPVVPPLSAPTTSPPAGQD